MDYWLDMGDCHGLDLMLLLLILQWFLISCYICEMLCGYIVIFDGFANVVVVVVVVNGFVLLWCTPSCPQKGR